MCIGVEDKGVEDEGMGVGVKAKGEGEGGGTGSRKLSEGAREQLAVTYLKKYCKSIEVEDVEDEG